MDFRKHSMLCYKIATKRQYGVTQKRNIQRVRVKVQYPVSPPCKALLDSSRSALVIIGEMPEWSIGPHSKCGERVTVPRVRIPVSPQQVV